MMRRSFLIVLVLAIQPLAASVGWAAGPSESELKAEFKQRHGVLERLKDRGKIGETSAGLVGLVRGEGGNDEVDVPGQGKMTVKALVGEENEDRRELYRLIGKRTGEPQAEVAKQAALRNFRKAAPNHWLELPDGRWVQKKDLPKGK